MESGSSYTSAKAPRPTDATAPSKQRDATVEPGLPKSTAAPASEPEPSPESQVRPAARPEHAPAATDPADAPTAAIRPAKQPGGCQKRAADLFLEQRVLPAVPTSQAGHVKVSDRLAQHVEADTGSEAFRPGGLLPLRPGSAEVRRATGVHEDRKQPGGRVPAAKLDKRHRESRVPAAALLRGREGERAA